MPVAINAEQLLYRSPGGTGRYTAQLLTVLPSAFAECEMIPFTARHRASEVQNALGEHGIAAATCARTAIQRLPRSVLYDAWLRFDRPAVSGIKDATLIHAPSVAVPPAAGRPLVVTVHDAAPELFPDAFPPRGRRFHRLGLAATARRADVVITVSEAAADEIAACSPISSDRIRVVHNGIDPPPPDAEADARTQARYGLVDLPYVLWVGSLEPRKGVGTLLSAMAEIMRNGRHPEVQTVLAGYEGWLHEGLINERDRATLGTSLHQLGPVTENDLWALYRSAAVFAFPSRHEGFGLPVVEAMSQGVPVVASDIPALREVSGGAAVLVDPIAVGAWVEAIEGLLSGGSTWHRCSRAGIERSRLFSAAAMAEGTRQAYRSVGF